MARLQVTFYAYSLRRPTDFLLFLPNDGTEFAARDNPHYARAPRLLLLLHGYSGGMADWTLNCQIDELSRKFNLAIVCPSGENSFYLNQRGTGCAYGDYTARELPAYIEKTFSIARENAIVGGLSMGGFGALSVGLSHPETFTKIIALSPALIVHEVAAMEKGADNGIADYDYYARTFGEPEELLASDNNPETLARRRKAAGDTLPDIYMACGTEDFLLAQNREFHDFLRKEDIPVTYSESRGVHDWAFWRKHIEPSLRWALADEERRESAHDL